MNYSRPPDFGFYALPDVLCRAADPNRNVPLRPISANIGSRLSSLLTFGLPQDALVVMMEMSRVTILADIYLDGSLKNPDPLAISCMRCRVHHKLLSLPRSSSEAGGIYECCRLTALLFAISALFPIPRETGLPQRLIKDIKQCIDQTDLLSLVGEGTRPFYIWALMLVGVAADGLPEREWAEETLTSLLLIEGASRWNEV